MASENRKSMRIKLTIIRQSLILAPTLRGSRPGVQSASLIMTSLMTS